MEVTDPAAGEEVLYLWSISFLPESEVLEWFRAFTWSIRAGTVQSPP